ncbi:MAG: MopE-related protein [Polyangiales bacterium]
MHGCARGMRTCGSNRRWGECQGRVEPQTETCNNMDDDCDGTVDNVYRECGLGICRRRMLACVLGREVPCTPFDPEPTERCNNLDDNCNGMVDEMLTRGCFSAPDSYRDRGTCRAGTQTCAMGEWGTCMGEVLPRAEVCTNTTDDDCDGTVNNGCPDM